MDNVQKKSYSIPISVKGIIIENGSVWLRKNERGEWELPGGKIDKGEQPGEALQREIQEELGLKITSTALVWAYIYTVPNSSDESEGVLVLTYTCRILSREGNFEYEGEGGKAEFKKVSLSELEHIHMPDFYKKAIEHSQKFLPKP